MKETFSSFFIKRTAITWLLIIGILIMGAFSLTTIPQELQPEINIPFGSIITVLPGANPSDVELLITEPLEKEISGVEDIKNISSTSALGLSTIFIEFEANADIKERIQDIKDKVDSIKSELPEDTTEPIISKAEANSESIINFSIIGDRPLYELSKIAEEVKEELEDIKGVSKVKISGNQEKQIEVIIDNSKVETYGLNINQIANIIKYSDFNIPVGVITTDKLNYSIRIDNKITDLETIRNININKELKIKDIARVEENYSTQNLISKLSIKGNTAKQAITLQIYKTDSGNIIKVAENSKQKISELNIDKDIEIAVSNDNSEFIKGDLDVLINSGKQTTILIILILFLALGLTEGILAGLSIPLTLLITITILKIEGMTINSLTLFSLVIALGLMVDTAIVIMEGVNEFMEKGYSGKEAAIKSVETYKWPLIAGTSTTIFAFAPMLLVSGILGEFLKALPITISAALISSLILSFTLIPSITASFLSKRKTHHKAILAPFFAKTGKAFEKLIQAILNKKIFRISTILIAITALTLSATLPASGALKVEMFPQTDFRLFIINIEAPKGLIIEESEKIAKKIEKELYEIKEIESFLTIIGTGQSQVATDIVSLQQAGSSNLTNITVNLVAKEEREDKSYIIADKLRKKLEKYTEVKITVQEFTEGPPSDSPIALRITGKEINKLKEISNDIQNIISSIEGTENVNDDLAKGLNEFKFTLDREILSQHNLSGIEVASTIRNLIQGIEAKEIKLNDEDIKIIVKNDIAEKNNSPETSIRDIQNFEIQSPNGYSVSLGQIADFDLINGFSSINHKDQDRIIKVKSDLAPNKNATTITEEIQKQLENYELPSGYKIEFGGDTEDIEQSFQELFQSMVLAVLLIMFTLVLVFNSLSQPFIIILTLPLALIGVFPGLYLMGLNLSFPAFLGVVALTGVVVNDAIVLIDRINNNLKEGIEFKKAITEAANARLQPIIMTTLTTVVGILPLALTNDFWAGLGFSLVFGLSAATMLTLIVIPVIYYMFEEGKWRK